MQQDRFTAPKQSPNFPIDSNLHQAVRVDLSTGHRSKPADEIVRPDRIHERDMKEPERWDGMS